MFIESLKKTNPALLEYAFDSIKNNAILPDTYILDLDAITENGKKMLEISKPLNIKMLFMLKQIGRNPIVAKRLMDIGFDGVVAVDFKESLLMARHQIPLGNIGHLVQIPKAALYALLQHKPEVITVYSYDKILEINETASSLNMIQVIKRHS
ncbi:MAG: YhfX family PLP-dependent enzyme, partial [Erysipelotrichia bacterium]|nr:YhfX family PLP-dependent enzyme [Erysipelotrichia bacterium]